MIKVENLIKTYSGKVPTPALRGISFEVKKGEFLMITGRSGAGKSTLLHQLGLLDTPTEGKIYLGGVDVTQLTDVEQSEFRLNKLGYVFQEYALLIELTALENVYLPHMAAGGTSKHYIKDAEKFLKLVDLGDRMDHYPSELSGGEQQRVAIARALVNDPEILFADEPTANLDTASSKNIFDLFRKLNKELNQTIVIVSHEVENKKWVDRVISLHDGLIEKD